MLLSKLDSARRQTDAAIRMLFHEYDVLAVLTVTHAANVIMQDLAERSGAVEFHNGTVRWIRPGKEVEFWRAVRKTPNFFKHANKDPDAVIEEPPFEDAEARIVWACMYYQGLTASLTKPMNGFMSIFFNLHPDVILKDGPLAEIFSDHDHAQRVRNMTRPQLMELGRSLL